MEYFFVKIIAAMFTSQSTPFKFASYKKNLFSKENKNTLLTSYDCVHWEYTKMAGMYCDGDIVLCKKHSNGLIVTEEGTIESKNLSIDIENFLSIFKESEGIDFVIIKCPPYFLLTRQPNNKVKVFMTTSNKYLEIFTDPKNFFGEYEERNINIDTCFTISNKEKSKDEGSKVSNLVSKLYKMNISNKFEKKENDRKKTKEIKNKEDSVDIKSNTNLETEEENTPIITQEANIKKTGKEFNAKNDATANIDNSFSLAVGNRMNDSDFEQFIAENEKYITVRYGNLKDNVIEFTRQPLKKELNLEFLNVIKFFSSSNYDFVEITGEMQVVGKKHGDRFIWFGELIEECTNPADSIYWFFSLFNPNVLIDDEFSTSKLEDYSNSDDQL